MRSALLVALLLTAAPLAPLGAGDNAIDDPFDEALERVYQRALDAAERRASAIAGPLARGADPSAEVGAFQTFLGSTFGTSRAKAVENLGKNILREEDARFADLEQLLAVADRLPGWHALATSRLAQLERDLGGLDREYDDAVDDMVDAAEDVLDEDEVKAFKLRFKALETKARALFSRWEDASRRADTTADSLADCGEVGKALARALEAGAATFEEGRAEFQKRTFAHLLDWEGGRSPSGLLFVRLTKEAHERYAHAKAVLTETVERCDERLSRATVNRVVHDLTERAGKETKRQHHYATAERFSRAQDRLEDVLKEIRGDLAALLARAQRDRKAAVDELAEDLEAVLPLAAKDYERKELREMARKAVGRAEEAADLALARAEKGALPEQLELLSRRLEGVDAMIVAIGAWSEAEEQLTVSMETSDSWRDFVLDTIGGALTDAIDDMKTLVDHAQDSRRLARIDEIETAYPGLRWTEAERVKRVLAAGWDLATLAPAMETLGGFVENVTGAGKILRKFLPKLEGDQDLLDEFVSDPDGFAAKELTNGLFDELDSLSFGSIADVRTKTTDSHFDALNTKEGKAVRAKLQGAIGSAVKRLLATGDPDAKQLAGSLRGLGQRIDRAFSGYGRGMNATFDAIATAAENYHEERTSEREDAREKLDDDIEDLAARFQKIKDKEGISDADRKALEAAVVDAEEKMEDMDDQSMTEDYEKAHGAAEAAVEFLRKAVVLAEQKV